METVRVVRSDVTYMLFPVTVVAGCFVSDSHHGQYRDGQILRHLLAHTHHQREPTVRRFPQRNLQNRGRTVNMIHWHISRGLGEQRLSLIPHLPLHRSMFQSSDRPMFLFLCF